MHSQHLVVLLSTVIKEVDIPSMFLRLMYMIENNMSAQRAIVADDMDTHLELEVQTSGAEEAYKEAVCEGTREGKDGSVWAKRVGVELQHVEGRLVGT